LDDFFHGKFSVVVPTDNTVSDCYAKYFQGFLESLRLQGLRKSSIKGYHYSGVKILYALYSHEVYDLSNIQPQDIYDVFAKSNDKVNTGRFLRSFYAIFSNPMSLLMIFQALSRLCENVNPFPLSIQKKKRSSYCQVLTQAKMQERGIMQLYF
jgi:hypothetical protein